MSEQVRGHGAASESAKPPEIGDVRTDDEGRVEYYDGSAWLPYGELPDTSDHGVLHDIKFRGNDGVGPTPS
ncbi:hypothetical protein [Streptomyces bluensis]|uniref:Uncharacterized protein n=1 Tax=Streptomyces bluensis TaxID=33897 RepID=A0ABW6UCX0_9ACTN